MKELPPIPASISHKNLNALIKKAKKEEPSSENSDSFDSKSKNDLKQLLINWQTISKDVLNKLNTSELNLSKEKGSKSLMALGAMEVHINMAMQALKAFETEE